MINKILTVLVLISVQFLYSQEIKFGKITKEELSETSYSNDESANAVVLCKNQSTYFNANVANIELITEIHERIKIYNKEGFDYATHLVNLFKAGSTSEKVGRIKAYTYNLENNEIVKTELEKSQIFKTEVSYNFNEVKFTMPNIKEGSIIEYKYEVRSPFTSNIDEFRFQYDIPIKKLNAEIRTPEGFKFNQTSKGYISFYPKRSTKTDNRLGMNVVINKYFLNNVPALKNENYVDNIDNYRAGVMFELVSITLPGYHRSFAQSWKDVARTIGSSDDYKNKLDKTKSFKDELDSLILGKTDNVEKMKLVYKYVKDNIKWNGIDGKSFYYGIKKALKEKKGNVADINLTLVAMLRYAGINANPLVISTKDNIIPFFPTVDRLNYVVAYAVINDKKYFLDATDEFSNINILPIKDYNWKGIFIDNHNLLWKEINIVEPELSISNYSIKATLNKDGSIEGLFNSRYTNHSAYEFRKMYKDQDLEEFIGSREGNFENIEISNYNTKNTDQYEGHVTESFDYFQENGADIINDKIYIQPISFLKMTENPFKLAQREFPIDFGHPFKNKYIVNITIPEGYKLESKPAPILAKIPDNLGTFKFVSKVSENNITLLVSFEINKSMIPADKYLFLKEFYNHIITKEAEQIVITKE